jgi:hypothetical protein
MKRRRLLFLSTTLGMVAPGRAILAQADRRTFGPEQLDQLLAPIALYPDSLLAQILMAAGYPVEVMRAARWSRANPDLQGNAATNAVWDENWDVSVKSLVAFPAVLMQLNEHLVWTQKLGDAMITQPQDVADSIQRLRARAADAGNLKSTPQQTINKANTPDGRTIVIEPASPDLIYVPSYDPNWAYGSWPSPDYPPTYYPPPSGYGAAPGILFGIGIAGAGAMFSSWRWGRSSYVHVNVDRAGTIDHHFDRSRYADGGRWRHDPGHRWGVAYRDGATRHHFGQHRDGDEQRQPFRHRGEHGDDRGGERDGAHHRGDERHGDHARGDRPTALSGTHRGREVHREAARGHEQQHRAASHHASLHGGGHGGRR